MNIFLPLSVPCLSVERSSGRKLHVFRMPPDAGATDVDRSLGGMSGRRGACVETGRLARHRRAASKWKLPVYRGTRRYVAT